MPAGRRRRRIGIECRAAALLLAALLALAAPPPAAAQAAASASGQGAVAGTGARPVGAAPAAAPAQQGPAALPQAQVEEPRAFGWRIGDLVERRIRLHIPAGWKLDAQSLPALGRRGPVLELRRAVLDPPGGDRDATLLLEYQVFASPPQVRTYESPPLALRFTRGDPATVTEMSIAAEAGRALARETSLRIEPWPLTVAPLVPVEVSPRRGLGELQPDAAPPHADIAWAQRRLLLWTLLALPLAAYLLHVYIALPWWAKRQRPLGRAWLALRDALARADTTADALQRAYAALHRGLDASAGQALFDAGVDRFVDADPRFAALRERLHEFFRRSEARFFAAAKASVEPAGRADERAWLLELGRALRDAERGAA